MVPFAPIMKSSISSRARFRRSGVSAATRSPSNSARTSIVSSSSAPSSCRRVLSAWATLSCVRKLSANPVT